MYHGRKIDFQGSFHNEHKMRAVSNGATHGDSIKFSNKAKGNRFSGDIKAINPAAEQIYRVNF